MDSIDLEILRNGIAGLAPEFGGWMCANAIVCFISQGHSPKVQLKVLTSLDEENLKYFLIDWTTTISLENMKSYQDENRTTDFGSMAIAVLLVLEFTSYTYLETSQTGSGIDFWLSDDSDDLNFLAARLEVSGIRKATTTNSLEKRVKSKLEQTNKSDDSLLPAYVAVVEFSKPQSIFIKK